MVCHLRGRRVLHLPAFSLDRTQELVPTYGVLHAEKIMNPADCRFWSLEDRGHAQQAGDSGASLTITGPHFLPAARLSLKAQKGRGTPTARSTPLQRTGVYSPTGICISDHLESQLHERTRQLSISPSAYSLDKAAPVSREYPPCEARDGGPEAKPG